MYISPRKQELYNNTHHVHTSAVLEQKSSASIHMPDTSTEAACFKLVFIRYSCTVKKNMPYWHYTILACTITKNALIGLCTIYMFLSHQQTVN